MEWATTVLADDNEFFAAQITFRGLQAKFKRISEKLQHLGVNSPTQPFVVSRPMRV
jgi:SOS response regulatory protein OraA/RecX